VAGIRQLASQTAWYGLSSIIGRFINYLLNPILTTIYASAAFGDISILFALAAFLNIMFTYGMETSYFRFNQKAGEEKVFNSTMTILLVTTIVFTSLLILPSQQLASFMELGNRSDYVIYVVLIVCLDTLAVIPFSRLRQKSRPQKFAFIKVSNILINVSLVVFFLYFCKNHHESGAGDWMDHIYSEKIGIGYVFISQLIASGITLLLLSSELKSYRPELDTKLLKEIFIYSTPLIIVGFGGMVNETIDRFMIIQLFNGTVDQARSANGIYSANYKLAALIVIFIQTFRMGAEPFFFKNAKAENAKENYVRIMNLFVIACCFCFLGVSLYLDIWKYFMGVHKHPEYIEGLFIVPILMLAKIFLGIYYNLSIWYKLTDRNKIGAYITIAGALTTIVLNFLLIPYFGYWACAIATTACYATMMCTSYYFGNKYYPIPYQWKKNFGYILLAIMLFGVHYLFRFTGVSILFLHGAATLLLLVFTTIVLKLERKELMNVPYLKEVYRFL
jgi:O-antigen/teichoic acid export membrane protein